MKLLHVTNIVSPHQIPLARCLAEQLGTGNYRHATTMPMHSERVEMGWDCGAQDPWILRVGESVAVRREYQKWWEEADVVLCGDRAIASMANRLDQGRLTFYMSERWWKPPLGMARLANPRFALMALRFRRMASCGNFHYLPIGQYAATDMQHWARFRGRSWLWGYFTDLPADLPRAGLREEDFEILYAGRMLDWKRVDTLVRAFAVLWRKDQTAQLTLIGDGPRRRSLEMLARRLGLAGAVDFQSSRPMKEIWRRMHSSHVYVLPSSGYEGWGAVINEAMTQGCAVVASAAAGSARTMIRHGENGFLFQPGDWWHLGELLCRLKTDDPLRRRVAQAGQRTIAEYWSPVVAAGRFLEVSEALLSRALPPAYDMGPMSPVLV